MRGLILRVIMVVVLVPSAASTQPADAPRAANAEPPSWEKSAKEACVKAMFHPEASKILDPKIYIDDCVNDTILREPFTFVEDAKKSYLDAIARLTISIDNKLARSKAAKHRAALQQLKSQAGKVQKKLGIGGKECPKDCSGHGKCTPTGCHCGEGFSGLDCSEANPENPGARESFQDLRSRKP